jgi:hypothetical protein
MCVRSPVFGERNPSVWAVCHAKKHTNFSFPKAYHYRAGAAWYSNLDPAYHIRSRVEAEASSSLIARLTFAWVWPLIRDSYARAQADIDDLLPLPDWLSAEHWCARVREARDQRM